MVLTDKKWLLVNCVRPKEPTFYPKCDSKVFLDLPDEFYPERYRPIANLLKQKFQAQADVTVPIPRMIPPDLSPITGAVKRRGPFSLFIPSHRQAAGNLISMLMGTKDVGEMMAMGAFVKDRANPYLFQYAYQVTMLHHPITKGMKPPSIVEQFPEQFIDPLTFVLLQEEYSVVDNNNRVS